ncbi:MAG: uracil DNA glycosylase [Pleopsidium flavum]|nr:MAG: uracil DNA glycosylase [Pleopsidium flavum]
MATNLKRKAIDLASAEAKKPKANGSITSFFGAPKPVSNTSSTSPAVPPPVVKFDKGKWLEKLTDEQKELLKLEIETLHESWLAHLKDEVVTKEFLDLKRFLKKEKEDGKTIFPPMEDVYSWYVSNVQLNRAPAAGNAADKIYARRSRHTPLNTVKAVILGQDPYHNFNQAHGLCFSVRPPTPAPPSLKNIYLAIAKDDPSFKPPPKNGGLLTPWADRGVLLLNTCLTVRAHEANSHANRGWEKFTQKVIDTVGKVRTRGVVFLAWGTPAGKRVARIDRKRHLVLQSVHPSPLSAARGFFDCGHFKKTNEWLKERYGDDGEIDWNLDVPAVDAGI